MNTSQNIVFDTILPSSNCINTQLRQTLSSFMKFLAKLSILQLPGDLSEAHLRARIN